MGAEKESDKTSWVLNRRLRQHKTRLFVRCIVEQGVRSAWPPQGREHQGRALLFYMYAQNNINSITRKVKNQRQV